MSRVAVPNAVAASMPPDVSPLVDARLALEALAVHGRAAGVPELRRSSTALQEELRIGAGSLRDAEAISADGPGWLETVGDRVRLERPDRGSDITMELRDRC